MGLKDITISFAMVMIFTVALIGAGIQFASLNNADISIADNNEISTYQDGTNAAGKAYSVDINDSLNAYSKTSLDSDQEAFTGGSFLQPTIMTQTKDSFGNIISMIYVHILGGGGETGTNSYATILYIITGTLGILIVFYVYKFAVGKNPD